MYIVVWPCPCAEGTFGTQGITPWSKPHASNDYKKTKKNWHMVFSYFLSFKSHHFFDFPFILRFLWNLTVRSNIWSYWAASGRFWYHLCFSVSPSLPIDSRYACSLCVSIVVLM